MMLLRSLHRWCGIVLAALLIVIGLSGAVAAFRGELVRVEQPAARGPLPDPASFGAALDAFDAAHDEKIESTKFVPHGSALHTVYLAKGQAARIDGNGNVIEMWSGVRGIGEWALRLHKTLLLGKTGETIAGIAGLAAFGMVATGLVIYWPARRGFSWRIWPINWRRPALLLSHRNLGLLLALPLAFQFATGGAMVFDRELAAALRVATPPKVNIASTETGPHWAATIAAAQAAVPDGVVRAVSAPRQAGAPYGVRMQRPGDINPEGATRVRVANGKVIDVTDPAQNGATAHLLGALLGIHTLGYIGGLAGQVLLATLGVLLAGLASFGALSWLRKRSR